MKKKFVLDNSVTMAMAFEDEKNAYSVRVIKTFGDGYEAIVPVLWRLEVANVLLMAIRKKRITIAEGHRFTTLLSKLPISIAEDPKHSEMENLLSLGHDFGLTSYDASYLSVALHEGLPIATNDKGLKKAAKKAGIKIFK